MDVDFLAGTYEPVYYLQTLFANTTFGNHIYRYMYMYMALHYYMLIFVDVIDDVSGGVGDLFKAAGDLTGVIQGGGKGKSFYHPQYELLLTCVQILCLRK